jgi:hypothetical protein
LLGELDHDRTEAQRLTSLATCDVEFAPLQCSEVDQLPSLVLLTTSCLGVYTKKVLALDRCCFGKMLLWKGVYTKEGACLWSSSFPSKSILV